MNKFGDRALILIIEHKSDIRFTMKRILENAGYRTIEAAKGNEGIQLVKNYVPDLVLIDTELPDMDSRHVLERIKAKDLSDGIFVVMITPVATGLIEKSKGIETVADGYISRPVSDAEFLERIVSLIRIQKTEKKLKESEERYRSLIESSSDHIFMLDRNGNYIMSNNKTYDVDSRNVDSLVGRNLKEIYPKDFAETFKEHLEDVFAKNKEIHFEKKIFFENKEYRHVKILLYPICSYGRINFVGGISHDITELKKVEESLLKSMERLRKATGGIIDVIATAVEIRDPYTAGHQKRVANLARLIANELGLSSELTEGIRLAGSIHDLGKISVPSDILSKPGRLKDIEYSLIKSHPQTGYDIIKDIEFSWPLSKIIFQHHERIDGSGYPMGLQGDEIMIESQILAVADVVEAILSHRPYRPAFSIDVAMDEIDRNKGILYNKNVADTCFMLFRDKNFRFS